MNTEIYSGKGSLPFFRVLTSRVFEEKKLDILEHNLPLNYTSQLLNSYTHKQNIGSLINFYSGKFGAVKSKEFADEVYFMAGIFPEYIDKRKAKNFYLEICRGLYSSLSSDRKDLFHQLSVNLKKYVEALNLIKVNKSIWNKNGKTIR